jgi:hypothetical protein
MTTPRTFSTDILHGHSPLSCASSRHSGGKELLTGATLIPNTVLPIYSCDVRSRFSRHRLQTHGPVGSPWSERRSALHGHAAASTDGHLPHDADRFASTRVRRAAAARDVRSAGTASPVPKYISSGVCPRNAEWGSTRLCWQERLNISWYFRSDRVFADHSGMR